jgi:DNA-damage-inducible protein J
MSATAMLHIRVDETLKQEAVQALEAMGLSLSDAVRLLLKRVASEQAWPLELKVPNATTVAAMKEARAMAVHRSRFSDAQAMFAALEDSSENNDKPARKSAVGTAKRSTSRKPKLAA